MERKRFEGRSALVTGAGAGFGRATAVGLAREGARSVGLVELHADRLDAVADEVAASRRPRHPDRRRPVRSGVRRRRGRADGRGRRRARHPHLQPRPDVLARRLPRRDRRGVAAGDRRQPHQPLRPGAPRRPVDARLLEPGGRRFVLPVAYGEARCDGDPEETFAAVVVLDDGEELKSWLPRSTPARSSGCTDASAPPPMCASESGDGLAMQKVQTPSAARWSSSSGARATRSLWRTHAGKRHLHDPGRRRGTADPAGHRRRADSRRCP